MVRVYFRKLRSRRYYANQRAFQRVVNGEFRIVVGPVIERALRARVANWEVVVGFDTSQEVTSQGVSIHVYPIGVGARYWNYVSRGVEGHGITRRQTWSARGSYKGVAWGRSKRRAALRLHSYRPMTMPGNVYGQAKWRQFSEYRIHVWWPGIAPRLFEENVAAELKKWYQKEMENTMRRAVRAAQKEAT